MLARGGLGFHRGDGLAGGGAGLGGVELGGVPGDCLGGGLGAGLLQLGGGLGADRLGLGFGGLGSPAAASCSPRTASWSSAADSCAPSRLIAASASSRMAAARLIAAVTGRSLARLPGELAAAPERGHRGVPDQHRRAVPAVLGHLLLAVAGPGTRRGRVLDPGRAGASRIPARAGCRAAGRVTAWGGVVMSSSGLSSPARASARRNEMERDAMNGLQMK